MPQAAGESVSMTEEIPVILVVEDNVLNQKVALILLERLGLRSMLATNGKEALELLAKDKFSLILMDCHMPEMDGFEAAVAIRKLESLSGNYTPIIAVTALAMVGDRERCIAAGMDDYISKPIDKNVLQIKINHWLRTDVIYQNRQLHRKYLRSHSNLSLVDGQPINLVELEEFYGSEQLNQMLTAFVVNTEDMIARMRSHMGDHTIWPLASLAHEVKASCASIGAKQLSRACLYLEQAVGQQDWIEAEQTLVSIERSFITLKTFIESAAVMAESPVL